MQAALLLGHVHGFAEVDDPAEDQTGEDDVQTDGQGIVREAKFDRQPAEEIGAGRARGVQEQDA